MKFLVFIALAVVAARAIDWKCDACKASMEVVQQFIHDETPVIEKAVRDHCSTFFGKFDPAVCPAVNLEVANLIALAEAKAIPEEACQLVKLCPKPAAQELKIDMECPACKMAVRWAQKYLGNETSVIEAAVDKECKAVFGKYAPFVCATIEQKLDDIIKYVELGLTPEEICQLVGLCKNAKEGCHTEMVCTCCPTKCSVKLVC